MLVLLPHDSCPLEMLSTPTLSGQTAASREDCGGAGRGPRGRQPQVGRLEEVSGSALPCGDLCSQMGRLRPLLQSCLATYTRPRLEKRALDCPQIL